MANPLLPTPPTDNSGNPLIAGSPTLADAWQYNADAAQNWIAQQRAESVRLGLVDPQTGWPTQAGLVYAARQYASGMLMGTTAPGVRAYHGSLADFERFDPKLTGTGASQQGNSFADPINLPKAMYLTSEKAHAAVFGDPLEFEITGPTKRVDAAADLESWAKETGHDNAQSMINEAYDGNVYNALNADHYFLEELRKAQQEGHSGISVDFGNIADRVGDRMGKQKIGTVHLITDPSMLRRVR